MYVFVASYVHYVHECVYARVCVYGWVCVCTRVSIAAVAVVFCRASDIVQPAVCCFLLLASQVDKPAQEQQLTECKQHDLQNSGPTFPCAVCETVIPSASHACTTCGAATLMCYQVCSIHTLHGCREMAHFAVFSCVLSVFVNVCVCVHVACFSVY